MSVRVAGLAVLLGLGACAEAPVAGDALGVASLDLTTVPTDARCATIDVVIPPNGTLTRSFDLGPGFAAVVALDSLPTGLVTLSEKIYLVACNAIAATQATPMWVSDPVKITLLPGVPADVVFVLRKVGATGTVTVRSDFPVMGPQLADFALPAMSAPAGVAPGADGHVWFTERTANKIGRISPSGVITEFALPTPGALPTVITSHPDGSMWFTQAGAPKLGRVTTTGAMREFTIPSGNPAYGITTGPDGNVWYTALGKLGRVSPTGIITEFAVPASPRHIIAGPEDTLWFTADKYIGRWVVATSRFTPFRITGEDVLGLAFGSDGALWLTIPAGRIARLSTTGASTVFDLGVLGPGRTPEFITNGTDGALWVTSSATGTLLRMTTTGVLSELLTPSDSSPTAITVGPDGSLWYADTRDRIGRVRF